MNTPSAKLLVLVGQCFVCVKIVGRANFTSSLDFRTLITELRQKGYSWFVLDLSECALMDSTFLGVLAGFGIKMGSTPTQQNGHVIELLNPNPRITELLENLGVLHLFKLTQGPLAAPEGVREEVQTPGTHSRVEVSTACLEAHKTLMEINPSNVARFKDVTQFLADDLKKMKAAEAGGS